MVLPRRITEPGSSEEERRLVEATLRGDLEAFGAIVETHQGAIHGMLLARTGDPEMALDLTQETLLTAWRRLETFDLKRPLRPWLLAIARNRWRDELRLARSRYPHHSLGWEGVREPVSDEEGPEQILLRRERNRGLWEAMERLSPIDRQVLLLKDLLELSYEETAAALSIPTGTAASRVFYARRRLREHLTDPTTHTTAGRT